MEGNKSSYCTGPSKPLAGVDVNTTEECIKDKYDQWAKNYDKDMIDCNYTAPATAIKAFLENADEHGINKDSKVIDIGAGTGVIGQLLKEKGYTYIVGVDVSPEMLEVAKSKSCYKELICSGIGNNSHSIQNNEYDALLCIGCLTLGHIKPSGITEMLNLLKVGGLFIVTIRCDAAEQDQYGYRGIINELITQQRMKMIFKEKTDYLAATADQDLVRYCYMFGFVRTN